MTDIILVDDHPLMRKGAACTIESESGLRVVGEMDLDEAPLERVDELCRNLVVVDVSLPDMSGIGVLKQLRSRAPEVKSLVVSRHDENRYAERCLRATS